MNDFLNHFIAANWRTLASALPWLVATLALYTIVGRMRE